jgi:hypothetical protein
MPIRHEKIIATVESSEFKPSAETLARECPQTLDNLYLDAHGYVIDAFHKHAIDVPSVSMVYAAAKVIIGRGPEHKWVYDLRGDMGAAGASPWEYTWATPEAWAACFARRLVETQSGCVVDEEVDADVVARAQAVLKVLRDAGVRIDDDLDHARLPRQRDVARNAQRRAPPQITPQPGPRARAHLKKHVSSNVATFNVDLVPAISTCHVSQETAKRLDEGEDCPWTIVAAYEHGWLPADLRCMDCDQGAVHDLPVYDW